MLRMVEVVAEEGVVNSFIHSLASLVQGRDAELVF